LKAQINVATDDEKKKSLEAEHAKHLKLADVAYKMRVDTYIVLLLGKTRVKQGRQKNNICHQQAYDKQRALEQETDQGSMPLAFRSQRGVETITSDFMGNICIPKLSAGEAFYKRKLRFTQLLQTQRTQTAITNNSHTQALQLRDLHCVA
jgi:hypothetical protein